MENVKSLINRHNRKTLRKTNRKRNQNKTMCNCRDNKPCALEFKCLQQNVVYKATLTTNSETKEYIGSTGKSFKKDGIHTSVTLKMRRTTELNFRSTYGNCLSLLLFLCYYFVLFLPHFVQFTPDKKSFCLKKNNYEMGHHA